ncbi:MAG: hypothetical protein ACI8WB_000994 [Phenylobacterium sp.]|jgi:hypothetical protein
MNYLAMAMIIFVSVGLTKLFYLAITFKPESDNNPDHQGNNNTNHDSGQNDASQKAPCDFCRSHHLIMERANIDNMTNDMNQYQAIEEWKARIAQYKADFIDPAVNAPSRFDNTADSNIIPLKKRQ